MFWKTKKIAPLPEKEMYWIIRKILFLEQEIGAKRFHALKTIPFTSELSDFQEGLTAKENTSILFEEIKKIMGLQDAKVRLLFHDDKLNDRTSNTLLSKIKIFFKLNMTRAGLYRKGEVFDVISLDLTILKLEHLLIPVIAHELSHLFLLGENRMFKNDECLTDLTAIVFGFGLFLGNMRSFEKLFGITHKNYFSAKQIAFAISWLSFYRKEDDKYIKSIHFPFKKYFVKTNIYLSENPIYIESINQEMDTIENFSRLLYKIMLGDAPFKENFDEWKYEYYKTYIPSTSISLPTLKLNYFKKIDHKIVELKEFQKGIIKISRYLKNEDHLNTEFYDLEIKELVYLLEEKENYFFSLKKNIGSKLMDGKKNEKENKTIIDAILNTQLKLIESCSMMLEYIDGDY